ncbi:response regulator [Waterburya agarophytonicola K14]|uniref:Response regulator n=1 Tax=Waterburya agarophytonicola KI4 TaxID=2874699 RepID=A0A964FG90_9CYAN|nr:response regulator [Waterburya agarophytonicola]MCC0178615.1 response regulator [Waterburya agarophytonicola KI4]
MIRILLVDDQKMVREALKVALEPEQDLEIVGTASNGIAAIKQVEQLQPDVVVMNMEMPGLDGAGATQQIANQFTKTKVLILTSYDSDEYVIKSLAMGAKGYLLKDSGTKDIAGAIRNINKGYTQISPGLLDKLLVYTDSGVVLSKMQGTVYRRLPNNSQPDRSTFKPQRTISSLQLISRQQQEEIVKLRRNLDNSQQELPKIKKSISTINKSMWVMILSWVVSLPLVVFCLYTLYNKTNSIRASMIPNERIGLNGEFSLSGIAERVAKEFKQDPALAGISTIYIAQEDDAIILTGKISDPDLLRRMENLAMEVTGVKKVYSSQVAIGSRRQKDLLEAQN